MTVQEYLESINKKETNSQLVSLRLFAKENNIPIITNEGIHFLNQIIRLKNIKNVLEIGTAIGYSAINMASKNDITITSIERKDNMFQQATKHIKDAKLESKITLIKADALEIDETKLGKFDLIFIDAAKSQSIKFFNKFKSLLNPNGIIITDNLLFHELVVTPIRDRNLKQLVGKITKFNQFVVEQEDFDTYIYKIGDGMSLSIKKD